MSRMSDEDVVRENERRSTLVDRLRASVKACRAVDRSELLEEAAAEIERLRWALAAARHGGR